MRHGSWLRLAVTLALTAALSTPVYGQGGTVSSISGTVVDTSGAVIPGADIIVKKGRVPLRAPQRVQLGELRPRDGTRQRRRPGGSNRV